MSGMSNLNYLSEDKQFFITHSDTEVQTRGLRLIDALESIQTIVNVKPINTLEIIGNVREMKQRLLIKTLFEQKGSISKTARSMKVGRQTIYNMISKGGLQNMLKVLKR
jgi:transcriptional regulator of acetoin/glycerol metabolism